LRSSTSKSRNALLREDCHAAVRHLTGVLAPRHRRRTVEAAGLCLMLDTAMHLRETAGKITKMLTHFLDECRREEEPDRSNIPRIFEELARRTKAHVQVSSFALPSIGKMGERFRHLRLALQQARRIAHGFCPLIIVPLRNRKGSPKSRLQAAMTGAYILRRNATLLVRQIKLWHNDAQQIVSQKLS